MVQFWCVHSYSRLLKQSKNLGDWGGGGGPRGPPLNTPMAHGCEGSRRRQQPCTAAWGWCVVVVVFESSHVCHQSLNFLLLNNPSPLFSPFVSSTGQWCWMMNDCHLSSLNKSTFPVYILTAQLRMWTVLLHIVYHFLPSPDFFSSFSGRHRARQ